MKKIAIIFCTVFALLLAGCGVNIYGCHGIIDMTYENAEKYSVGNFSYSAADVKSVSVNWIAGKVTIVESNTETLSVSEKENNLEEAEQLHYLIENGKLTIQFRQSDYKSFINFSGPDPKEVTVEIPSGVTLDLNVIAADVYIGVLNADTFEISSVSGNVTVREVFAKNVKAESVSGNISILSINSPVISAETVSGGVELDLLSANSIDIKSVSGGITLSLNGLGAKVKFDTTSGSYHQAENSYVIGDGRLLIDVETVSGSLSIN